MLHAGKFNCILVGGLVELLKLTSHMGNFCVWELLVWKHCIL